MTIPAQRHPNSQSDEPVVYSALEKIGLTSLDARCYELLDLGGTATGTQLSIELATSRTSLYRVLRRLRHYGFVKTQAFKLDGDRVARYHALPLEVALARYSEYQREQVKAIITDQKARRPAVKYWSGY